MYKRLLELLVQARAFVTARRRFVAYRPQVVTWDHVGNWLKPYSLIDRALLCKLLNHVRYYTDDEARVALVEANERVLTQLSSAGVAMSKVIYVQIHDAGSSSGVMLNVLRDSAKLERAGCLFLDGSSRSLAEVTRRLGEGAIVYVDDFAGSGKQFTRVHREISPFIVGSFVEFFVAPCVAEEAVSKIAEEGVDVVTHEIHKKHARPLRPECNVLTPVERDRLLQISSSMYSKPGLGFMKLATMVVFSRQCPNSVPLLLRGSEAQNPFAGILPRTTDLPSPFPRQSMSD